MRRIWGIVLTSLVLLAISSSMPVFAQGGDTSTSHVPDLLLFTSYPSQMAGIGETVTLNLSLRAGSSAQAVRLTVQDLPENWTASFRGKGRIVQSVFVQPEEDATVDLRVEIPTDAEAGAYEFTVIARGNGLEARLPIELTVEEKAPASLALSVDLPTVRGRPDTTFRYNVTLRNDGDEDLTADLTATTPPFYNAVFKSGGQEVTSIPVSANGTERLSVELTPLSRQIPAGVYPATIRAQGGEAQAELELAAEVVGQASLNLTTPDDRLSGEMEIGADTSVTLWLQNTGSAAAHAVDMSASSPSGWSVEFEPATVDQLDPGQQAEITAHIHPSDKALAGDYVITFRARPEEGATESVEYRVTARTSTLWGIVGIVLIAVAVGAVGLVVARFGRR